jgi:urease alpha subunit
MIDEGQNIGDMRLKIEISPSFQKEGDDGKFTGGASVKEGSFTVLQSN